jgi:hypothetical protein
MSLVGNRAVKGKKELAVQGGCRNQARGSLWAMAVVALGLPSVVFFLSHVALEQRRFPLPGWLDGVLAWALALTGVLGTFTTVGAVLVAIAGSFLAGVSGKPRMLMWTFAAVSLLALVYLAQVRL